MKTLTVLLLALALGGCGLSVAGGVVGALGVVGSNSGSNGPWIDHRVHESPGTCEWSDVLRRYRCPAN